MLAAPTQDELLERMNEARRRLEGVAHRTLVATSATLDQRVGAQVFLKC